MKKHGRLLWRRFCGRPTKSIAVRVNASWTDDAGFINAPNLYVLDSSGVPVASQPGNLFSPPQKYSKDGVNAYQYRSARVAALWKPNEDFHAQLSYYHQLSNADGFPYVATTPAAYNQPISAANQPSGSFTNPALAPQLYNAPVPAGVDRLSTAENTLTTTHDTVGSICAPKSCLPAGAGGRAITSCSASRATVSMVSR